MGNDGVWRHSNCRSTKRSFSWVWGCMGLQAHRIFTSYIPTNGFPRSQPSHCFRPATLDSSNNNWPRNVKQTHCLLVGNHGGLRHSNCGFSKLSFSWVWGGITLTIHTVFQQAYPNQLLSLGAILQRNSHGAQRQNSTMGRPQLLECHDGMCFHTFKTHGEHTL